MEISDFPTEGVAMTFLIQGEERPIFRTAESLILFVFKDSFSLSFQNLARTEDADF